MDTLHIPWETESSLFKPLINSGFFETFSRFSRIKELTCPLNLVTYFTLQVQVFTKYGQFIRKFGADILQHPRGVTTDNCGRIIVVECKVMRVVIFDMVGNVLNKFSCSRYVFNLSS